MWRVTGWSRAATFLRRALSEDPETLSRRGSKDRFKRMANPFQFLQEVRAEAKKVTWPSRRETMIATGLVVLMVLAASLFFVVVDSALRFIVGLLLRAGQ